MHNKHKTVCICRYCGDEFTTNTSSHAKFCPGKNCKDRWHHRNRKDRNPMAEQSSPTEAEAIRSGEIEPEILVEKDQKIEALSIANRTLRQKYRAALTERTALECLSYTGDAEAKMVRASFDKLGAVSVPACQNHDNVQHLVLFLSCLHYGEVVSKYETNGINEYNVPIAQSSYEVLVRAVQDLIVNHHSGETFEKLWIIDVGDNVSGNIHKELEITKQHL